MNSTAAAATGGPAPENKALLLRQGGMGVPRKKGFNRDTPVYVLNNKQFFKARFAALGLAQAPIWWSGSNEMIPRHHVEQALASGLGVPKQVFWILGLRFDCLILLNKTVV